MPAKLSRRVIPLFQEPWDVRLRPLIGHKVRGQPLGAGCTGMSKPAALFATLLEEV